MRSFFKTLAVGLAVLLTCTVSYAKPLTVGFAQIGAESSWRVAETESVKTTAKDRGINLKFSDGQGKQANQIKALRAFVAQKVDAIILAPVVETGWEPVLKAAKRAHIPVFLADRSIKVDDDSLYVTLVAGDFVLEAINAAKWLIEKTGGKANIIELQGTPGSSAAIDRKKGFAETIANEPGMKIIASQSGDFRRSKGKEVMEALLKVYDNVDAVFAHNDDMAIGAIQAIEEAGLKPSQDIIIVSIDGVKGAFEAMVAGKLNCTVECNPLLGPALFDAIDDYRAGKKLPKKLVVEEGVFPMEVAAKVIGDRKY